MGLGGAALIGGGAAIGGISQAYGAGEASRAQTAGNRAALASQEAARARAVGYLQPYEQAGESALNPLTGLLTGQSYDPTTGQSTAISPQQQQQLFTNNPGYQFNLNQTLQALSRSQAAGGYSQSTGGQKEIAQYASGLASNQYNNVINQLFGLEQVGQGAATAQAQAETGFASGIAQSNQNIGQSQAGYYNALGQIGGGVGSSLSGAGGLMAFMGNQSGGGNTVNPLASATGNSYGNTPSYGGTGLSGNNVGYGLQYQAPTVPTFE